MNLSYCCVLIMLILCPRNDYVYVCRKKRNTTKEDSVKKEVPLITERIDEENADLGIEPKISKAQE